MKILIRKVLEFGFLYLNFRLDILQLEISGYCKDILFVLFSRELFYVVDRYFDVSCLNIISYTDRKQLHSNFSSSKQIQMYLFKRQTTTRWESRWLVILKSKFSVFSQFKVYLLKVKWNNEPKMSFWISSRFTGRCEEWQGKKGKINMRKFIF